MCLALLVTCKDWGKSGKRKRGRAGIFDFLFLNFFATKIQDFSSLPLLILSLSLLFCLLSALLYLVGSLYHLIGEKAHTAIKSGNIFDIHLGILGKQIFEFFEK